MNIRQEVGYDDREEGQQKHEGPFTCKEGTGSPYEETEYREKF